MKEDAVVDRRCNTAQEPILGREQLGLLRARRERPGRRTGEQRDELAAF
jgi:hypothetical protein